MMSCPNVAFTDAGASRIILAIGETVTRTYDYFHPPGVIRTDFCGSFIKEYPLNDAYNSMTSLILDGADLSTNVKRVELEIRPTNLS